MTDRLHRLIAVADLAAEVGADWVVNQAVPAPVLAADSLGVYRQPEQRGYGVLVMWLNGDTVVSNGTIQVGLRPVVVWRIAGTQRVAWDDTELLLATGAAAWYTSPYGRPAWLKVTTATAPPGGATHLAIYVSEVRQ